RNSRVTKRKGPRHAVGPKSLHTGILLQGDKLERGNLAGLQYCSTSDRRSVGQQTNRRACWSGVPGWSQIVAPLGRRCSDVPRYKLPTCKISEGRSAIIRAG